MNVYHDLHELPAFRNAVVTIGSFDGVHQGHQQILRRINALAAEVDGESIVVTFHPHPRQVIYPNDNSLQLITTIDEKVALLERFGVDNVVVVPFTSAFASQRADAYIEDFLVDKFSPRYVVIGYDHRFGQNRQGDINYLRFHAQKQGFEVIEIEKQAVKNIAVSSTKVRLALNEGDVDRAAKLLGHYFTLTGTVERGQQIGRTIGFPTANLAIAHTHKLIPPDGIYAVRATHKERSYDGMLYIGQRPTLKSHDNRTIEVNLFDFDKEIYGDKLRVELIAFLRGDAQFESLEELKAQLQRDKLATRKVLAPLTRPEKQHKEDTTPSVAIVILNYNGRQWLEKMLPSVVATDYPDYRLVVADNASTDDSVAWLAVNYPGVACLELAENYGFAEGYNRALRRIKADYFVLLNSDVEVTPHWLTPVIERMERQPTIGAAQPKIRSYHRRGHFEYAGAAGGFIDRFGYPFCRGRIFDTLETDTGQYDTARPVFWATGAALFVRGPLFERLGGFDGRFFAHMEEIDLCWRLQRAGYEVWCIPQSTVYHVGGGTLDYTSPRKTYLNFRNNLGLLYKQLDQRRVRTLFYRLVLDGAAGWQFLWKGQGKNFLAVLRAHLDFYRMRGYWKQRRMQEMEWIAANSIHHAPQPKGRLAGSAVWRYFLLGKKTFQRLWSEPAGTPDGAPVSALPKSTLL